MTTDPTLERKMRRLIPLLALPVVILALAFGCTKERELAGPDKDMTCIGCHSDEAALQDLLADGGKYTPPAFGREDG